MFRKGYNLNFNRFELNKIWQLVASTDMASLISLKPKYCVPPDWNCFIAIIRTSDKCFQVIIINGLQNKEEKLSFISEERLCNFVRTYTNEQLRLSYMNVGQVFKKGCNLNFNRFELNKIWQVNEITDMASLISLKPKYCVPRDWNCYIAIMHTSDKCFQVIIINNLQNTQLKLSFISEERLYNFVRTYTKEQLRLSFMNVGQR